MYKGFKGDLIWASKRWVKAALVGVACWLSIPLYNSFQNTRAEAVEFLEHKGYRDIAYGDRIDNPRDRIDGKDYCPNNDSSRTFVARSKSQKIGARWLTVCFTFKDMYIGPEVTPIRYPTEFDDLRPKTPRPM